MFSWITNKISISDSQLQLEGSNHFVFSSIDKPHNFFVVHDMDLNYDLSFEMNCFKTIKLVFTTIYIIYFDYYYDYENYSKIFSILFQIIKMKGKQWLIICNLNGNVGQKDLNFRIVFIIIIVIKINYINSCEN